MPVTPAAILNFWIDEVGPSGWYVQDDALDARIRHRFGLAWRMARRGAFGDWAGDPAGAAALAILLDQFPRNMFRGRPESFATDARALRLAHRAIGLGFDRQVTARARLFLYMPLEHSEALADQDASVRLFAARMTAEPGYLLHARAHREVIRRFGRFPFRNAALGRETTEDEAAWMAQGGYGRMVARLSA